MDRWWRCSHRAAPQADPWPSMTRALGTRDLWSPGLCAASGHHSRTSQGGLAFSQGPCFCPWMWPGRVRGQHRCARKPGGSSGFGGAPATGLRAQTSQISRESPQGRVVSVSLPPPKLPELQMASLDAAWPTDEPGGRD